MLENYATSKSDFPRGVWQFTLRFGFLGIGFASGKEATRFTVSGLMGIELPQSSNRLTPCPGVTRE